MRKPRIDWKSLIAGVVLALIGGGSAVGVNSFVTADFAEHDWMLGQFESQLEPRIVSVEKGVVGGNRYQVLLDRSTGEQFLSTAAGIVCIPKPENPLGIRLEED